MRLAFHGVRVRRGASDSFGNKVSRRSLHALARLYAPQAARRGARRGSRPGEAAILPTAGQDIRGYPRPNNTPHARAVPISEIGCAKAVRGIPSGREAIGIARQVAAAQVRLRHRAECVCVARRCVVGGPPPRRTGRIHRPGWRPLLGSAFPGARWPVGANHGLGIGTVVYCTYPAA
jgi:hypothetical protein